MIGAGLSLMCLLVLCSCGDPEPPISKKTSPPPPQTALAYQVISLDNLDAFQATDGNWEVVSEAFTDRTVTKASVEGKAGVGVLINNNTQEKKSHLLSKMEHGDLEMELEFMMAKGSNSGIYLQGRYEVQLLDSWGVENPDETHCGGIYHRWDDSRPDGQKGYEGHPPRLNASRAPGLWQHLTIRFQAPRFDASGNKTANARMLRVVLNGIEIHKDVELFGPTRASFFADEQATGPLMIQGDHGPLAIRNIGIKPYTDRQLSLGSMTFKIYELESNPTTADSIPDFTGLTPSETGETDTLSRNLTEQRRNFGMLLEGTIEIPETGAYLFSTQAQGGLKLLINGKEVLDYDGEHEFLGEAGYNKTDLQAGSQPFQLLYRKQHRFWKNGLALFVEGPGIAKMPLHAPGSPMQLPDFQPLALEVDAQEASAIRGYVLHKGMKHTHTISVGMPAGLHYNYDIHQAAWLNIWSGDFLDVRQMWANRGIEQLAVPLGPSLELDGLPSFAQLSGKNAPWPDSLGDNGPVQSGGYELTDNGEPIFLFEIGGATIKDHISATASERKLSRTISVEGELPANIWLLLASGEDIKRLPNGAYAINDMAYYLETGGGPDPSIRGTEGHQELILSLTDNPSINYSLIW